MTEDAVRVAGLTRRFGSAVVVNHVDFAAARGELFGLVGPDGAGKTTTLRMLAGVLRPSDGDAFLEGVSVAREPERVKTAIAYMSQRFGLYADLTVLENLSFYADLYEVPADERRTRLERLFQFSNLGPFRDRLAGQLSGGMKQKLGLSCALIHQPRILLLDEPTFGVDPISRRDLWLVVHEMVAEGVTVVVSTSYLDEAERFDRVAFLHEGRLVALDTPAALRRAAGGIVLMVAAADLRGVRDRLSRLAGVRRATVFGDRLHVTAATQEEADRIARALVAEGAGDVDVRRIEPTLEDVFIDRMSEEAQ